MDVQDPEDSESPPVLLRPVTVVLFEAIARVNLSGALHQLALDDLGKAARERDCRDECVGLDNGDDPGVESEMSVLEPICDVDEGDAGVYGLELFF